MNLAGIIVVLLVAVVVVFFFLSLVVRRLLYVSAPNEALIFSRRAPRARRSRHRLPHRARRAEPARPAPRGGDAHRPHHVHHRRRRAGAYSKGGIPLNVVGVANVKVAGDEPLLNNAVERFLGKSRPEIMRIAKETLEGNLRGVLAQLTPEQVNEDKTRFAQTLIEEAEHDMNRMGLVLDTLKIQNVSDDTGYLNSIGRIRGSMVRQSAAIAEA